jgi:ABC-type transporter Mla MlaB component
VVITLHSDAGHSPALITESSFAWISEARGTIELDFSGVAQVSSQLIAWLFHLIQAGRLTSLVISKANSFVVKQLKQVYLDRFVTISYG